MQKQLHENGPYYTQNGSIYSRYNDGFMMDEDSSVIVDVGTGTLLKVGKRENIEPYYRTMCQKYNQMGFPEFYETLRLVTFNVKYEELNFAPEGYNFSIDEVCTIINWFNNSIGDKMKEFLDNTNLNAVKAEIERLQLFGF